MGQAKSIFFVVCALVAVIVAVQNTEAVETRLLFVTLSMPRVLLLLVTLLIGLAMGVMLGARLNGKADKKAAESDS